MQLLKWLADGSTWRDHALQLVELAYKLQVEHVYHDAFVHLVGIIADQKHDFWKPMKREELPEAVRSQVMDEYCRISQLEAVAASVQSTEHRHGVTLEDDAASC
jgi:hypothetical protein